MSESPSSSATSPGRMAWLIVALLAPVAMLNYLDRQMLAAMKTSVMADITDIGTDANWGRMLGQFKWVYAVLSLAGGYLADRFSRRATICGSLFAWSAVTWWTGHARTYDDLLMARTLMGVSEAFYIPAALALITDYHTGPTRSRAIGLHQMGIYCGGIAGGFSGYVADSAPHGWRLAFDFCGVAGMLLAVPLLLLLRDAPREPAAPGILKKEPHFQGVAALLRNRSFLLLVLYFTLPALAAWVVRDWMPAILKTEFGIGQGRAGVSATLYWQIAAIIGAFGGGWLADRLMRKTARGRIYVSALGMLLIIPAMLGVGWSPQTGQVWVAVMFLALFGLGWGFFDTNNMPILCQIARPRHRATGYGLMNFVSISAGGMADWVFGILRGGQAPLTAIFCVFAGFALVSAILVLLIKPRYSETGETL